MSKKIKRLLIANRGEIVCRIVATCRAMGIETVTLYAADDADLPHARAGDVSVLLEGEKLSDTYLNMDKIIAAAKASKTDAVHPGYGFLSENARFAAAVENAGLIFVGPPKQVIASMGDKAESRKLCQKIGLPVVPGYDGAAKDIKTLTQEAEKIGYPLLVKAAAGGGGKGMRIVEKAAGLAAAIESARSEARNAFGDDRLLLEKYLTKPRHIEVQVFSDTHGKHLHFFERECSIQRRYQKIVEESPAPGLSEKTRSTMTDAAVNLTRHMGYVGAGTVEFIMDASGEFYFLEMNTRLQVEHPVTEMVTGLDLVKLQIEVAEGKKIPFGQKDIKQNGHAIEVRLYAEDTAREFLPAPGTMRQFRLPHLPHVRCENGYDSGNSISSRYDPMIAKLASWGEDRKEAISRLLNALRATEISGVTNNRAFLMRVLGHAKFAAGDTTTHFISMHKDALIHPAHDDEALAQLAAAYLLFDAGAAQSSGAVATEYSAWNNPRLAGLR